MYPAVTNCGLTPVAAVADALSLTDLNRRLGVDIYYYDIVDPTIR